VSANQGCSGSGTLGNGAPHLIYVLLYNGFEAVFKWLSFWMRSHTFFVSSTFLAQMCLAGWFTKKNFFLPWTFFTF